MASEGHEDLIAWARYRIQASGYPADDLTDAEVAEIVRRMIGGGDVGWRYYAGRVRPPVPVAGEDLEAGDLVYRLDDGMYYRVRGRPPG